MRPALSCPIKSRMIGALRCARRKLPAALPPSRCLRQLAVHLLAILVQVEMAQVARLLKEAPGGRLVDQVHAPFSVHDLSARAAAPCTSLDTNSSVAMSQGGMKATSSESMKGSPAEGGTDEGPRGCLELSQPAGDLDHDSAAGGVSFPTVSDCLWSVGVW